jgi:hypothetical protein
MKLRWGIVLGLLVLAGCDASVCTNRDSLGNCEFDGFDDFDSSTPGMDSSTPASGDGSVTPGPDSTVVTPVADAGIDAAVVPDAGPVVPATLTLQQFCEARYARAVAWRDTFELCCASNQDRKVGDDLLVSNFNYSLSADTVGACVSGIQALPAAHLTFVGTAASACATKLAEQFAAPPATCTAGGFDAQDIEAKIGHQALPPVQIAECRAALLGNVAFNSSCTNPLECKAPYRCVDMGGNRTCRDALTASSACTSSSECADGLLCVTSAGSTTGKVCRAATQPLDVTVACSTSVECASGTLCDNGKCAAPVVELICK